MRAREKAPAGSPAGARITASILQRASDQCVCVLAEAPACLLADFRMTGRFATECFGADRLRAGFCATRRSAVRLPAVRRPAVSVALATVSAAIPARTRPRMPIRRPSSAPPTNAAAGKTSFRVSICFLRSVPTRTEGNSHGTSSVPDATSDGTPQAYSRRPMRKPARAATSNTPKTCLREPSRMRPVAESTACSVA